MTISEEYLKEKPNLYDSWMKMNYAVLRLITRLGDDGIIWKNMSVENCNWWHQFAVEEEFYEAAIVYRDGVHKCYDYKQPNNGNSI